MRGPHPEQRRCKRQSRFAKGINAEDDIEATNDHRKEQEMRQNC